MCQDICRQKTLLGEFKQQWFLMPSITNAVNHAGSGAQPAPFTSTCSTSSIAAMAPRLHNGRGVMQAAFLHAANGPRGRLLRSACSSAGKWTVFTSRKCGPDVLFLTRLDARCSCRADASHERELLLFHAFRCQRFCSTGTVWFVEIDPARACTKWQITQGPAQAVT